ncbi:MAG TPA: hypothetical protein VLM76_10110 [Patescibacteria group bacterium]|nr:hypothetical protein [Patescibacteria group bacterium]
MRLDPIAGGDHRRGGLSGLAVLGSARSVLAPLAPRHEAETLPERVFIKARQAVHVLAQFIERRLAALDEDQVLGESLDQLPAELWPLRRHPGDIRRHDQGIGVPHQTGDLGSPLRLRRWMRSNSRRRRA